MEVTYREWLSSTKRDPLPRTMGSRLQGGYAHFRDGNGYTICPGYKKPVQNPAHPSLEHPPMFSKLFVSPSSYDSVIGLSSPLETSPGNYINFSSVSKHSAIVLLMYLVYVSLSLSLSGRLH